MNILVKLLLLGQVTLVSAGSKKDDFSEIKSLHDSPSRNGTKKVSYYLQRDKSYKDMVRDRIFNDHISVMASNSSNANQNEDSRYYITE